MWDRKLRMKFADVTQVIKLLDKYRPESKEAKKARLLAKAEKKVDGKSAPPSKKPPVVRAGLNTVSECAIDWIVRIGANRIDFIICWIFRLVSNWLHWFINEMMDEFMQ